MILNLIIENGNWKYHYHNFIFTAEIITYKINLMKVILKTLLNDIKIYKNFTFEQFKDQKSLNLRT